MPANWIFLSISWGTSYAQEHSAKTKVIFLNDGPGLLLGSMWDDYAKIEDSWPGRIMIVTLRMIPERITLDWFRR